MGSAFHQLCPRYSGTLTSTAPTAIKLWDTFTFTLQCLITSVFTPKRDLETKTDVFWYHSNVCLLNKDDSIGHNKGKRQKR